MTSLSKMKPVVSLLDETLESAFPPVYAGVRPLGTRVLVQLKNSARKTTGGLIIGTDATQTEDDNTQVAKVIALGPVAYRNRETLELWPEGEWVKPGDFVRIPLHTNSVNSHTVPVPGQDVRARFTQLDDLHIICIQDDPFYIKAFL
jgi:co-chaperonin GroES (HSP10)